MSNQDIILTTILDCGICDLRILDDIGYDLAQIIEDLMDNYIKPTLNEITNQVFQRGANDLDTLIYCRICELEDISNLRPLNNDEEHELKLLQGLDIARDIEWYCNCLDSRIYFVHNEEIYRTYLGDQIEEVEIRMGFSF